MTDWNQPYNICSSCEESAKYAVSGNSLELQTRYLTNSILFSKQNAIYYLMITTKLTRFAAHKVRISKKLISMVAETQRKRNWLQKYTALHYWPTSNYQQFKACTDNSRYTGSTNPSNWSRDMTEKVLCSLRTVKGKGKSVPLQAWSGPEGSRKLKFPDFMSTAQEGGKVVSLTHRLHLPPGNSPGTHFC